jgi:hypothetical protein
MVQGDHGVFSLGVEIAVPLVSLVVAVVIAGLLKPPVARSARGLRRFA